MPTNNSPKKEPRRQRARNSDGQFKGDNPATPDLNEAWVPTEAEVALDKGVKYTIAPKVTAPSPAAETAGKYGAKPKIRPTFGNVTSTTY